MFQTEMCNKRLNMTQKAFANMFGVSKRTVEARETGKSTNAQKPLYDLRTAVFVIYFILRNCSNLLFKGIFK